MFKKRHLQVRLVKDEKVVPTHTLTPEPAFGDKVIFVTEATRSLVRDAAKCVGVLFILDTARKVAIEYAKK